jgi:erythritol kinase
VQQKLYPDMQACAAQWVDPWLGESTMPDAALANIYEQAFAIYRAARVAMRPQWQAHHALKRT